MSTHEYVAMQQLVFDHINARRVRHGPARDNAVRHAVTGWLRCTPPGMTMEPRGDRLVVEVVKHMARALERHRNPSTVTAQDVEILQLIMERPPSDAQAYNRVVALEKLQAALKKQPPSSALAQDAMAVIAPALPSALRF